MEIEYKITYKKPEWKHWGEISSSGSFENYPDAVIELDKLMHEGSSGIYRIIRISYEVAREEEVRE